MMPKRLGGRPHLGWPSPYHQNDPQVNEIIPLAPGRPYYPGSPLAGGQLRLNSVADGRRRRGFRGRLILLDFAALDLLDGGSVAQTDAPRFRADLDNLEIVFLARLQRAGALQRPGCGTVHRWTFVTPAPLFDLRVVAERFDVFAELDKRTEGGDARNLPLHELPDLVSLKPVAPDVVHLLDAQRHAAIFRIDLEHFRSDRLAFAEDFVRIFHAPGPSHVDDVHQAVKSIFDFDKRSELRDVADLPRDHRADRIFFRKLQPRVRQRLLHAQGNAAVARLDVQDDYIDLIPDLRELGRMHRLLVPAHFRYVHEPFHALFEFDEDAIVHDTDDLAVAFAASGRLLGGIRPRIWRPLLYAERDALLRLVKLPEYYGQLLLPLHHFFKILH